MSEKTDVPSMNLQNIRPPSEAGQSLERLISLPDLLHAGAASSMSTIETVEPSGIWSIEPTDGENARRDKKLYDIALFYAEESEDEVQKFYSFLEFLLRSCGREARIWALFNDSEGFGRSFFDLLKYGLDNSNYYFLYIDRHFVSRSLYDTTMEQVNQWASFQTDVCVSEHINDVRKRVVPIVTAENCMPPFPANIMTPMKIWKLTDGRDFGDFFDTLELTEYRFYSRFTKDQLRYLDDLKRKLKYNICPIERKSAQRSSSNASNGMGNASEYGNREPQSFAGTVTVDREVENFESNIQTTQEQRHRPTQQNAIQAVNVVNEIKVNSASETADSHSHSSKWSPAVLVLGGAAAGALVATIYYNPPSKKMFSALLNWLVLKPLLKKVF